jgi:hypothetical protein
MAHVRTYARTNSHMHTRRTPRTRDACTCCRAVREYARANMRTRESEGVRERGRGGPAARQALGVCGFCDHAQRLAVEARAHSPPVPTLQVLTAPNTGTHDAQGAMAGFEFGSGIFSNSNAPEADAAALRDACLRPLSC